MSGAVRITLCDRAPALPADQTAFHAGLVEAFQRAAVSVGWRGVKFTGYQRDPATHQVVIEAEEGPAPATIAALRTISKRGENR